MKRMKARKAKRISIVGNLRPAPRRTGPPDGEAMYLEIQALKSQLAEEPGQISGLNEVHALRSEVLRLREENNRLSSENTALRNENTSIRSAIRDGQHC
ncbi:hypothetical protein PHLGIDRAFT_161255 [Phlebiopsis gigantea 11061_1 CR5-6]|uniref:Uncharacterized protein n=1 Tax=Phlebiopsis gigantea (strain 11061_1 CR5-6) TaxID=745531 RepID=A0A0C3S8G1_PHLG1|nr:hypothetical protein PHLGIDRAFT_161255 [Phlebiopsis gigantea 11061_1 CR5-6]